MVKHNDWDVSESHLQVINDNWPAGVSVRPPILRKNVQGVTGKRITEDIKSGIWMKPLGSNNGRTFSGVRDVTRSSLVVFVSGTTTGQSAGVTDYEKIRDMIRDKFQDRRATGLNGELFSSASMADYDIDDTLRRKYDIDIIEVETLFREDKG